MSTGIYISTNTSITSKCIGGFNMYVGSILSSNDCKTFVVVEIMNVSLLTFLSVKVNGHLTGHCKKRPKYRLC